MSAMVRAPIGRRSAPMASNDKPERLITVPGHGSAVGVPDVAEVSLGVQVVKSGARDARAAGAQALTSIVDSVKALGIDARQIRTFGLNLGINYGREGKPS